MSRAMRKKELEKLGYPLTAIRGKRAWGGEELGTRTPRSFAVRPMELIRSCGDRVVLAKEVAVGQDLEMAGRRGGDVGYQEAEAPGPRRWQPSN